MKFFRFVLSKCLVQISQSTQAWNHFKIIFFITVLFLHDQHQRKNKPKFHCIASNNICLTVEKNYLCLNVNHVGWWIMKVLWKLNTMWRNVQKHSKKTIKICMHFIYPSTARWSPCLSQSSYTHLQNQFIRTVPDPHCPQGSTSRFAFFLVCLNLRVDSLFESIHPTNWFFKHFKT